MSEYILGMNSLVSFVFNSDLYLFTKNVEIYIYIYIDIYQMRWKTIEYEIVWDEIRWTRMNEWHVYIYCACTKVEKAKGSDHPSVYKVLRTRNMTVAQSRDQCLDFEIIISEIIITEIITDLMSNWQGLTDIELKQLFICNNFKKLGSWKRWRISI